MKSRRKKKAESVVRSICEDGPRLVARSRGWAVKKRLRLGTNVRLAAKARSRRDFLSVVGFDSKLQSEILSVVMSQSAVEAGM